MNRMKLELTGDELQIVEKRMDELYSLAMTAEKEFVMDGQFRAGGNKLLTKKQNEQVKKNFWKYYLEHCNFMETLKSIRDKCEIARNSEKSIRKELTDTNTEEKDES